MGRLYEIKRDILGPEDDISLRADDGRCIAVLERDDARARKLGVFSLRSEPGAAETSLPDGIYENLLDSATVTVRDGKLHTDGKPVVLQWVK
jgi:hypothetical protein